MGYRNLNRTLRESNNVINMQRFLLRSEFEQYKQELRQKELEKKSNRWFWIGMIFVITILTYLTIHHEGGSLFSYSNQDSRVTMNKHLLSKVYVHTGFNISADIVLPDSITRLSERNYG
tara:strand:+ start:1008 stop:1364 length:357 start_codon:yes stop_codon:yes gene_type:complete